MGTVTVQSNPGATWQVTGDHKVIFENVDPNLTSDGYHTFEELYAHRNALFLALLSTHPERGWWSKKHHDGSSFAGWVIAGINLPGVGDVTYHFPESEAPLLNKVVHELELAPEWDRHSSTKVLDRITDYALER